MFNWKPKLFEIRLEDYGKEAGMAFEVILPVKPFGTAEFSSSGDAKGHELLSFLCANWAAMWPPLLERLQTGLEDYHEIMEDLDGVPTLGKDEFLGGVSRSTPGCFMGEESDFSITIDFDKVPLWDCFFKGTQIVHFQPVF